MLAQMPQPEVALRVAKAVALPHKHSCFMCVRFLSSIAPATSTARRGKAIFVAATSEHTGKTSVSMALMAGLIRRFGRNRVGYMKPVGQKHVVVKDHKGEDIKVDKDVAVAKEHFGLEGRYIAMSPLVLEKGYTKNFLDGKVDPLQQREAIKDSFEELISNNDFVVVEGTGHMGVGSIVGWNNADVASLLGLDVLLIANGGLGSTYDLLSLNRALCESRDVKVRAVILNKVTADKMEMIRRYLGKAFNFDHWDAPILGVVPWADTLDQASVLDLELMFKTTALAGREHLLRRFGRFELVTTSLRRLLEKLSNGELDSNTCFVTHASRNDIALGLLSHSQDTQKDKNSKLFEAGLVLTGTPPGHIPHSFVSNYIKRATIPVLSVGVSTTLAMRMLDGFKSKMNVKDSVRTNNVIDHYEPYIDFDALLACAKVPLSSSHKHDEPIRGQ